MNMPESEVKEKAAAWEIAEKVLGWELERALAFLHEQGWEVEVMVTAPPRKAVTGDKVRVLQVRLPEEIRQDGKAKKVVLVTAREMNAPE